MNVVLLQGILSSDPIAKSLPSGVELINYEVTTRDGNGVATVPVVWIDPKRAAKLGEGDEVVVGGRVRRRFFRVGGATMSRTEVVADFVLRPSARRAEGAIAATLGRGTESR